jgi:hypothetical protein
MVEREREARAVGRELDLDLREPARQRQRPGQRGGRVEDHHLAQVGHALHGRGQEAPVPPKQTARKGHRTRKVPAFGHVPPVRRPGEADRAPLSMPEGLEGIGVGGEVEFAPGDLHEAPTVEAAHDRIGEIPASRSRVGGRAGSGVGDLRPRRRRLADDGASPVAGDDADVAQPRRPLAERPADDRRH